MRVALAGHEVFAGTPPATAGVLGIALGPDAHLRLDRCRVDDTPEPTTSRWLGLDAVIHGGEDCNDWERRDVPARRCGSLWTRRQDGGRAVYVAQGTRLRLWLPPGCTVGVDLDGWRVASAPGRAGAPV